MPKLLKRASISVEPEPVRRPLVKGAKDQAFPECILIRYDRAPKHPFFKLLNPKYNFKETYYRYDKKAGKVRCLVTLMPDGTRVAWDTCGMCMKYFSMCVCKAGIQSCRSIEYIHDAIEAKRNNEEWGMGHPNYRGSLSRAEREARRDAPQRFVMPERPRPTTPAVSSRQAAAQGAPKKLLKRAAPPEPPRKLLKKSTVQKATKAMEDVDARGMLSAAEEMVDAMTKQLFEPRPKKVLMKAPVQKKIVRKASR